MIEAILKYQETDAKLRKIEIELSGSEERKKALSAKKYLEGVEENVAKLELRASELSAAYENACAELKKMQEQETEFTSAKAEAKDENGIGYLIKKTDEMLAKIKSLAAEIGRVSNEIQSVLKDYSVIKKSTQAAKEQYVEYGKKYNELAGSKKQEMEEIESQLAELKKDVDPALMSRYLEKRKAKIFPIIFELNGNVCGACNMELPTSVLSKLDNGEVIECENCRRLLYKK